MSRDCTPINDEMIEELNPLKDAQKKAKKKSKGLSRFCTMKKDAGDVELGIKFFNNAMGSGETSGEAVGESLDEEKEVEPMSNADAFDALKNIDNEN